MPGVRHGSVHEEETLRNLTTLGLNSRRGTPGPPQTFDRLVFNRVYIGWIDVPAYAVSTQGDFEPLVTEKVFHRVQAILDGRLQNHAAASTQRPRFSAQRLRAMRRVRNPLTASWSKGRSDYYAYYHCRPCCRAVNIGKANLEELFVDELARLQPTTGFMRLVKDRVLHAWRDLKSDAKQRVAEAERKQKTIRQKLDRLDEAFLYEKTIDIDTYDRQHDRLREELTLARMDRHSGQLEELDVEGILTFAERILPRASDLWVQASLDQRQRFQQLFFPDGVAFDGNRFIGTGATAPAFSYLREIRTENEGLVGPDGSQVEPDSVVAETVGRLARLKSCSSKASYYALRARTAGRSAGVGRRTPLAGTVTTDTVLPIMSKNST